MISNLSAVYNRFDFIGLHNDDKSPEALSRLIGTKLRNGCTFFEMDTQKVLMFDEQNNRWIDLGEATEIEQVE